MANTTTSPNMNLPVPVPGVDPGVDWANNIVADMYAIDSHNHSTGQGVQITPSGLSINDALPMNGNNLTTVKSVRFSSQASPLAAAADIGCVYESGVDLYYNDGNGNQIRITQSGSVSGSAGTITGLPSGTASASFAGATFTFQSATLTPATMAVGPLVIGRSAASSKTVTLSPNAGQASNYNLTLPVALPASTNFLTLDSTGAVGFNIYGYTGTGSVVLSISPTLSGTIGLPLGAGKSLYTDGSGNMAGADFTGTGAYVVASTSPTITTPNFVGTPTGTITGGSYTPTVTMTTGSGSSSSDFVYTRVGNIVTFSGRVSGTTAGSSAIWTVTLPIAVSGNFSRIGQVSGAAGIEGNVGTAITRNAFFSPIGGTAARVIVEFASGNAAIDVTVTGQYLVY